MIIKVPSPSVNKITALAIKYNLDSCEVIDEYMAIVSETLHYIAVTLIVINICK